MALLTTLETARRYVLGPDVVSSDADDEITRLVAACSAWFEKATDRSIKKATYSGEVQNGPFRRFGALGWYGGWYQGASGYGNLRHSIVPRQYPVLSVASVSVNGEAIPTIVDGFGAGWALVDDIIYLVGYAVPPGIANVAITYDAGYASVPADVEQAVLELVAWRFKAKDRVGQANRSLPSGEVLAYVGYSSGIASIDAVVELYRRPGAL